MNKKLLAIEGNMGSGKSTMLSILKEKLNASIIPEPTKKWQHVNQENNLLNLFYKDTPRWAYTFQSYAFLTRVNAILDHYQKEKDKDVYILERSVYCDRFCFAKNCHERGVMSNLEWHIYKEWFSWLAEKYAPKPSGFIYLKTTPHTSYDRMTKRRRTEESDVTQSYLQTLHDKHEDWLIHNKEIIPSLNNIPILVLDVEKDFEHDRKEQNKHIVNIQNFIANLTDKPENKTNVQHKAVRGQLTSP